VGQGFSVQVSSSAELSSVVADERSSASRSDFADDSAGEVASDVGSGASVEHVVGSSVAVFFVDGDSVSVCVFRVDGEWVSVCDSGVVGWSLGDTVLERDVELDVELVGSEVGFVVELVGSDFRLVVELVGSDFRLVVEVVGSDVVVVLELVGIVVVLAGLDDGVVVVLVGVDDGLVVVLVGVDDGLVVVLDGVDDGLVVVLVGVDDGVVVVLDDGLVVVLVGLVAGLVEVLVGVDVGPVDGLVVGELDVGLGFEVSRGVQVGVAVGRTGSDVDSSGAATTVPGPAEGVRGASARTVPVPPVDKSIGETGTVGRGVGSATMLLPVR
jgi:hypothetical protein